MQTLKDLYLPRTRGGNLWTYNSDLYGVVRGAIFIEEVEIPVSWIRDAKGNLFSQHGRAYDIQKLVATASNPANYNMRPPRDLDVEFVVSDVQDAWVKYRPRLTVPLVVTGSASARVGLLVNGNEIDHAQSDLTATLTLSAINPLGKELAVSGFVPAGQTVKLVSAVTGSATVSLAADASTESLV